MKPFPLITLAFVLPLLACACQPERTSEQDRIATQVAGLLAQTDVPTPEPHVAEPSPVPTLPEPTAKPASFEAVKLAWFYGIPIEKIDPTLLVQNIDLFISTQGLEQSRDQVRGLGSKAKFFQYILFSEIENPRNCGIKPYTDQVADRAGDFCSISDSHPDWFLTTSDGERIHTDPPYENYWVLDPGNKEWQEFWLSRMQEREKLGWDGIFLDNVEALPRIDGALDAEKYPDESSYQMAVIDFLQTIHTYFQGKNIPVYANIIGARSTADFTQLLYDLDGAMLENFAVDWENGYYSAETWREHMDIARIAQEMGKEIVLVSQGPKKDTSRETFALASFLLVQNGKAVFRYTHAGSYDELWLYDNYQVNPGQPLGAMYNYGDTWQRDFENGTVKVNPSAHTAEINIR